MGMEGHKPRKEPQTKRVLVKITNLEFAALPLLLDDIQTTKGKEYEQERRKVGFVQWSLSLLGLGVWTEKREAKAESWPQNFPIVTNKWEKPTSPATFLTRAFPVQHSSAPQPLRLIIRCST